MVRKGFTAEQIINKLREAEIQINQAISIAEASRMIGVTQQTYYRWRQGVGCLADGAGKEAQEPGEGERSSQEAGS